MAPGSLSWLLPSQWKRRARPKGRGPDMGAGGIGAAFAGSSSPGTVLAVIEVAWTGLGRAGRPGAGPGLTAHRPHDWKSTVQRRTPVLTVPWTWTWASELAA